jgi:hypothetical protein
MTEQLLFEILVEEVGLDKAIGIKNMFDSTAFEEIYHDVNEDLHEWMEIVTDAYENKDEE